MRDHTSDEGWQIMQGLQSEGYTLYGAHLRDGQTDVGEILELERSPGTVVVQDKKEWRREARTFRDPAATFHGIERLEEVDGLFRLTVLRDAHYSPSFHREAAMEMGCHAWVVPYHPAIVHYLAPYTRPEHLIRTYHSVDPAGVPEFSSIRTANCLVSGAVNNRVYPLRTRIFKLAARMGVTKLRHPGYHRNGTNTYEYLETLGKYKVAICTSSIYGYALRKIIEATACGCVVITDLPTDEVLPAIDGNLVRVNSHENTQSLINLVQMLADSYNPDVQYEWAAKALAFYDYREVGRRLVEDIKKLRANYNGANQ
jgi:hypothetical protein